MNQQEEQVHEKQRGRFAAVMKRLFPTFVSVVSLGADTSAAMKAEHEALRKQALIKRAAKQKRA